MFASLVTDDRHRQPVASVTNTPYHFMAKCACQELFERINKQSSSRLCCLSGWKSFNICIVKSFRPWNLVAIEIHCNCYVLWIPVVQSYRVECSCCPLWRSFSEPPLKPTEVKGIWNSANMVCESSQKHKRTLSMTILVQSCFCIHSPQWVLREFWIDMLTLTRDNS